jgi:predicted RNA binding protein YcfA (HicA-like mRNA interferase family)
MKKVYSSREIVKILTANHFLPISRKGSHIKYYKAETNETFVLTTDKNVNPMVWRKMVKTYNIILNI